jgi:hypothetical protein
MKAAAPPRQTPGETADPLAAPGVNTGPAAVIRELARDMMRHKRLKYEEAARIGTALRDHDWQSVRTVIETALRRVELDPTPAAHPNPAALPTREEGAAAAAEPKAAQAEMTPLVNGLLRMVLQLCESLPRLTGDTEGFVERFAPIRSLLTGRLTPDRLREAQSRIGALIDQHAQLMNNLQVARSSLKEMFGLLIERLGAVGSSTARFQERVGSYQQSLSGPVDAPTLARIAGDMLNDTRAVSEEIARSQQELVAARRKVESYELRVRSLEQELAQTSRMVQNDPLTHALNRRGLEEVFRVEVARSQRHDVPLTIVMLDLDDFKQINDSLGHAAGDRALLHFVTTARASLRST